jgi:hypothetical protein
MPCSGAACAHQPPPRACVCPYAGCQCRCVSGLGRGLLHHRRGACPRPACGRWGLGGWLAHRARERCGGRGAARGAQSWGGRALPTTAPGLRCPGCLSLHRRPLAQLCQGVAIAAEASQPLSTHAALQHAPWPQLLTCHPPSPPPACAAGHHSRRRPPGAQLYDAAARAAGRQAVAAARVPPAGSCSVVCLSRHSPACASALRAGAPARRHAEDLSRHTGGNRTPNSLGSHPCADR